MQIGDTRLAATTLESGSKIERGIKYNKQYNRSVVSVIHSLDIDDRLRSIHSVSQNKHSKPTSASAIQSVKM
jgi:hypothetical protein